MLQQYSSSLNKQKKLKNILFISGFNDFLMPFLTQFINKHSYHYNLILRNVKDLNFFFLVR